MAIICTLQPDHRIRTCEDTATMSRFLWLSFFLLFCVGSQAQEHPEDDVFMQISSYNTHHPNEVLYLSTDKYLYTPTETIWFSGYLFDNVRRIDSLEADLLSVALVRKDDLSIALRKNYLVMDNLCSGSLTLSDTIAEGKYQLVAHTNIVDQEGQPVHTFLTSIQIVRPSPTVLGMDVQVAARSNRDTVYISTKTYFPEDIPMRERHRAQISYHVSEDSPPRQSTINVIGNATLAIPKEEIDASDQLLYTTIQVGKRDKSFVYALPELPPDTMVVDFYAEGGHAIYGVPNRFAWRVKPTWGEAAVTSAVLLQDEAVLDTLYTDRDGMGIFYLTPEKGRRYSLRMLSDDSLASRTNHPLPTAVESGVGLRIEDPLAHDTLTVEILSPTFQDVHIGMTNLHNREMVLTEAIAIHPKRKIKLPLHGINKGLHSLTILDKNENILAEQPFFASYGRQNNVFIKTDKSSYATRDSVALTLSLENDIGQPVAGVFTVSCVHQPRLDTTNRNTISSNFYSQPLGNPLDLRAVWSTGENPTLLANRLFTDTVNRNIWQTIRSSRLNPEETVRQKISLEGKIGSLRKKRRSPLSILVLRDNHTHMIEVGVDGIFSPEPSALVVPEGQFLIARVMEKDQVNEGYRIIIEDPLAQTMPPLISSPLQLIPYEEPDQERSLQPEQLYSSLDMPQLIETVYVRARERYSAYGQDFGANACGDWVCSYGVLNCPNHPPSHSGTTQPIAGKLYRNPSLGGTVVYAECLKSEENQNDIAGIYTARNFQGMYLG